MTTLEEYIYDAAPKCTKRIHGSTAIGNLYISINSQQSINRISISTSSFHKRIRLISLFEDGMVIYDATNMSTTKSITIPYCRTEEEYFQYSLLHDLSDFTLDDFKACWYCYLKTMNNIEIM